MKRFILFALAALVICAKPVKADEGMWLLPFIQKLNIKDMEKRGFKLSAEDIYSINNSSIRDAIVIFGGGCTGEVVSDKGLLLTNHHCGYGVIQQHSSLENDYLKYGFWAKNFDEEIPSPGLSVVFIRNIADVSDRILPHLNEQMTEEERNTKVSELVTELNVEYSDQDNNLVATVRSMFGGNQYLIFVSETFGDVRMVGTPPSSIGKFGGDIDNWTWPRHTGDFSVFRIYSTSDNKSTSKYQEANVPYTPKQHLKVSLKGYEDGDFAMIMGFPGSTYRYMTSWEMNQLMEQDNANRIYIRGARQEIMKADMEASDEIRIKYATKYTRSSNFWKNSIGKNNSLKKQNVMAKKEAEQAEFTAWVNQDKSHIEKYGEALPLIQNVIQERAPYTKDMQYISECLNNIESLPLASRAATIMKTRIAPEMQGQQLKELGEAFFKDYSQSTDRKISPRMLEIFVEDSGSPLIESLMNGVSTEELMEDLFNNSIFVCPSKFNDFAEQPTLAAIENDPALLMVNAINSYVMAQWEQLGKFSNQFNRGQRLYLAGLLEMNQGKKSMYPDANFTIRMTYGRILPYWAADAMFYHHYTTLSGVMAKEDPTVSEFVVPEKLKELWQNKDFGRYAYKGDVPVAFLSDNDITGGNSGSPVLNGNGELLGLAFDANWEGMAGDIIFLPEVQRTISVDIRYVLFVIDKYAGATRLIDEMTIVE